MEVILKKPVINLGDQDDVVKVKAGYARNYLIPQGLAMLATSSAKRALEEKKRQAAHKQDFLLQQAQELADNLTALTVKIETLAGVDGKLFGSVTPIAFANKLKDAGFDIDRRQISFSSDIKELGEYVAIVHLSKHVKAEIPFAVINQQAEA